jgi:hypothetical protein
MQQAVSNSAGPTSLTFAWLQQQLSLCLLTGYLAGNDANLSSMATPNRLGQHLGSKHATTCVTAAAVHAAQHASYSLGWQAGLRYQSDRLQQAAHHWASKPVQRSAAAMHTALL